MGVFDRYAPFIQDFIYQNSWTALRGIQVAAGEAIFDTKEHVLLTAATASGKTEAAFFPILSKFYEDPPASVGAVYIGPLKALINDQFMRLNDLCREAEIPVWHWHGDVAQSHKNKLLKHPSGILQITPESLEALLLRKHGFIPRLFGDLRFVVIDEVHSLMRGDRGGQTLCLIQRLSRLAQVDPRRIGLSATIGDPEGTGRFLASGTNRGTVIPKLEKQGVTWRLSMEHFYVQGEQAAPDVSKSAAPEAAKKPEEVLAVLPGQEGQTQTGLAALSARQELAAEQDPNQGAAPAPGRLQGTQEGFPVPGSKQAAGAAESKEAVLPGIPRQANTGAADVALEPVSAVKTDTAPAQADPAFGYIFAHTQGKKCLVFVNSREECEVITTTLRQYCELRHEPERFLIHHGNLSASYRETAEEIMRDEEQFQTTVTTATLELGIDIGRLERAFQINAPFTVSSFLQRMGRTGRRDLPPEMWFVIREDPPEARAMLPTTVPWTLLQGIALIQLYVESRWVEPPKLDRLPFSLLYHQTMCTLAASGEMTPGALAQRVLSLSVFHRITQEDYRILLQHLLKTDHIQRTEVGGLIVGLAGERQVNSYKFYAVFQENEEYTVRSESRELGTIVMPPPVGEKIALAGRVWVVEEIDHKRHLVYCQQVKGIVPAYFGQCAGDINTRILERMREVLQEDRIYPYLRSNAVARLKHGRTIARHGEVTEQPLVCLGGEVWCLFPWLGTYAFLALERFLKGCAKELGISAVESSRPYFIQFKMKADPAHFFRRMKERAAKPIDPMSLVYPKEVPCFEKYDEFLPEELVRRGFAYGILDIEGMRRRILGW